MNNPLQITMSIGGGAAAGKTAMSFNWISDTNVSTSEIIYGTSSDLAHGTKKSATMAIPVSIGSVPDEKLVNVKEIHSFKVTVEDLTPETKYYYKVGNADSGYSSIESFIAPADPDAKKPFSFVVSPDTQIKSAKSSENTEELYNHIKENESDAAFLIHNGDLVEDASFSDYWQHFFDAAQNLANTLPIMATPGNHDSGKYDKDCVQFTARTNYSSLRKPSELSAAAEGTVYSFEYGDALFISLNSYASPVDDIVQWEFLKNEAAATTKKWKIVNIHSSPYDPGASHYRFDNLIGKKFTDAGIDLVLSGHEHVYSRTTLKTISSDPGTGSIQNEDFGQAPTYVVQGSVYNYAYGISSTEDTSWNDFFYDLRINKVEGRGGAIHSPGVYSKVEVTNDSITHTTYYKAKGPDHPFCVIDSFTITK